MGLTGRRRRRQGRQVRNVPAAIVVEVERLVIDGLESIDHDVVVRAVEAELGGRLADTVSADWAAVAVDGLSTTSNLRLVSGERSSSVGGQIARSVCRTLADGGALQESGRTMDPWRSPSRPA